MNVATLLDRAARGRPDQPAVALGSAIRLTYRDVARRAHALAGWLRAAGLRPGARVALVLSNCVEYVELLFATWHAGLVTVPINAKLHPREIAHIVADSEAEICFGSADVESALSDLPRPPIREVFIVASREYQALVDAPETRASPVEPDDGAWLFYTSGTTGRPKGAVLTHRNLLAMTLSYFADVDRIDPGDTIVHAAPMSHGSGLYVVPHVAAAALHLVPESARFDPGEIGTLMRVHRGVTMFAAPTMIRRLLDHPGLPDAERTQLKTIVYGGGPMYVADLEEALRRLGNRMVQIYGQGECPMTITCLSRARHGDRNHPRYLQRLASVGTPFTSQEVRVAGPDDSALPPGEMGEVLTRGDVVMRGYWRDAPATAAALRGGWLHTGDIGVMDEDGFLTLKDRSKDLIITGGSNVYPREVEEVLLRHQAVREVAVIGRPDPEWGERVVAFVVIRPETTATHTDLDAWCLDHLARFKRPRAYRFVEQLPKNNYGKVLKRALREREEQRER